LQLYTGEGGARALTLAYRVLTGVPQHPVLLHSHGGASIAADKKVLQTGKRYRPASKVMNAMRGRMFMHLKPRILRVEFHPTKAYLFIERKYDLDCCADARRAAGCCSRRRLGRSSIELFTQSTR
jgi:hypothetical protein